MTRELSRTEAGDQWDEGKWRKGDAGWLCRWLFTPPRIVSFGGEEVVEPGAYVFSEERE